MKRAFLCAGCVLASVSFFTATGAIILGGLAAIFAATFSLTTFSLHPGLWTYIAGATAVGATLGTITGTAFLALNWHDYRDNVLF